MAACKAVVCVVVIILALYFYEKMIINRSFTVKSYENQLDLIYRIDITRSLLRRQNRIFNRNESCCMYKKAMLLFLLLTCGDIELNPGPNDMYNAKVGMKFYHQNIRGLLHNFANLQGLFEQFKNIDIMTISETHIINSGFNDIDELYEIPGYNFIKRNRKTGHGGGVCI